MTVQEKIQKLANLLKTAYGSLGHKKSERYHEAAAIYEAQLKAEGIHVPPLQELLAVGVYNG